MEAQLNCPDNSVEKDLATALFRIFQETLTNIARHANATLMKVRLDRKDDELRLYVFDNGKGITQEQIDDPTSFGIMGIGKELIYGAAASA